MNREISGDSTAGFCLSFDDDYIDDWHGILPLMDHWDVRATFFITQPHKLSKCQVSKLREIKDAGHEIGAHGLEHKGVEFDFNRDPERIEEYESAEVVGSLEALDSIGIAPRNFAFPYGQSAPLYVDAVLRHFEKVRLTSHNRRLIPLRFQKSLFYRVSCGDRVLSALGIDHVSGISDRDISSMFKVARKKNTVACLYGHRVADIDPKHSRPDDPEAYRISEAMLRRIFKLAGDFQLKSYTFSEM